MKVSGLSIEFDDKKEIETTSKILDLYLFAEEDDEAWKFLDELPVGHDPIVELSLNLRKMLSQN